MRGKVINNTLPQTNRQVTSNDSFHFSPVACVITIAPEPVADVQMRVRGNMHTHSTPSSEVSVVQTATVRVHDGWWGGSAHWAHGQGRAVQRHFPEIGVDYFYVCEQAFLHIPLRKDSHGL